MIVLVTGAGSGIGLEVSRQLILQQHRVIMVGREKHVHPDVTGLLNSTQSEFIETDLSLQANCGSLDCISKAAIRLS